MTIGELYELESGDVLLFNSPEDVSNQYLRLRLQSGEYYRARLNGAGVNIESGVNSMSEEYSEINEQQVASAGDLPVRLTFDLGEITMPFDNVKYLKLNNFLSPLLDFTHLLTDGKEYHHLQCVQISASNITPNIAKVTPFQS